MFCILIFISIPNLFYMTSIRKARTRFTYKDSLLLIVTDHTRRDLWRFQAVNSSENLKLSLEVIWFKWRIGNLQDCWFSSFNFILTLHKPIYFKRSQYISYENSIRKARTRFTYKDFLNHSLKLFMWSED